MRALTPSFSLWIAWFATITAFGVRFPIFCDGDIRMTEQFKNLMNGMTYALPTVLVAAVMFLLLAVLLCLVSHPTILLVIFCNDVDCPRHTTAHSRLFRASRLTDNLRLQF